MYLLPSRVIQHECAAREDLVWYANTADSQPGVLQVAVCYHKAANTAHTVEGMLVAFRADWFAAPTNVTQGRI